MEKIAIAAIGKNKELGRENSLLWQIPSDLKRFKKITLGHPIIMGYKTFESIGRALPDRTNIVLTRVKPQEEMESVIFANSPQEALSLAEKADGSKQVFIIGGGQIYKLFLPLTDKLFLTEIDAEAEADVFFPEFENEFKKTKEGKWQEENGIRFRFCTWEKKV